ncbi:MAG: NAD(P)/FAD-dependent oxidoreductase [Deltaproteobacteria bacterium]|nr:NAD(P)/FAD-dependent oxidoreductase [Deltaproteobacteria bacterium]
MMQQKFKVLILGGGTGGIAVAARLMRDGLGGHIAIIDPSEFHDYQPYWTLAGVGLVSKNSSRRSMTSVVPPGVTWIKASVKSIDPDNREVVSADGQRFSYDILVVALGLTLNYDHMAGAQESLGKQGVISVYQFDQLDAAREAIENFSGGTAIFTMPPVPIKCAGAPQKVMYLADDIWRRRGVRAKSRIIFASAGAAIFGIPEFAASLSKVIARKEIETWFQTKLVGVRASDQVAVFERVTNGEVIKEEVKFDLLHVVPPMSAPRVIKDSPLASDEDAQRGWLAVDKHTLQHLKFPNVFGVGDVTGVPNSKTGAAIRKQAPVVAANIAKHLAGQSDFLRYDGYSSCPLITDIGKVILAEFGYDGKLMPSFPLDPTKERRLYWHLKKDLLPTLYWQGMMKGRM